MAMSSRRRRHAQAGVSQLTVLGGWSAERHTEEFYEVTDASTELPDLAAALAKWEVCYNTVRPHLALGYLTPAEWLSRAGYSTGQV